MGNARLRDVHRSAPRHAQHGNLRKHAKLYLRWHRERYYPVDAQIRALLPRFRDAPDIEILAREFKLADAQELVARREGFDSWPALLQGVSPMTSTPNSASASPAIPGVTLIAAEPQLFVRDINAATEFYTRRLGFAVAFSYGDPPFYAQVVRDGARLNLRHVDSPVIDPAARAAEQLLAATIVLDDAKPLFLEYQAAGVAFSQSLRTEPWGARTFIVCDVDGNLILFAGGGR
jgi:catechol 2,3-dioxygenase-like lactoylglutathione lyase family enzyme